MGEVSSTDGNLKTGLKTGHGTVATAVIMCQSLMEYEAAIIPAGKVNTEQVIDRL